jgi:hypothetical protein
VRLNADIFPRVVGVDHGGIFVDTPPAPSVTWEYEIRPVTAARKTAMAYSSDCMAPCSPRMWESIPKLAGPVTVGTVGTDYGWGIHIAPYALECWSLGFYVSGTAADLLRPHLGSSQVFRFYGDEGFTDVIDGTELILDRFEPLDPTPTARTTWGQLKTLYR